MSFDKEQTVYLANLYTVVFAGVILGLFLLFRLFIRLKSSPLPRNEPEVPVTLSKPPDFLSEAIPQTNSPSIMVPDSPDTGDIPAKPSQPPMGATANAPQPNQISGPRKHYTPVRQIPINPQNQPTKSNAPKATSLLALGWPHRIWAAIAVLAIIVAALTFRYKTVYFGTTPFQVDRWTGTLQPYQAK